MIGIKNLRRQIKKGRTIYQRGQVEGVAGNGNDGSRFEGIDWFLETFDASGITIEKK